MSMQISKNGKCHYFLRNHFLTKFGQEVYFDITNRFISQKLKNSKEFPISPEKTKFWEISEQNSRSEHTYVNKF